MNKKIELFWKEFLKNPDVYIAIIAAILFFVLGIIGTVSISIVLSSTLAILAILAFSILKNRQINEATETALESLTKSLPEKNKMYETKERAYKFLEEYISTHYVKEATLIQHSGITCQNLLKALRLLANFYRAIPVKLSIQVVKLNCISITYQLRYMV